MIAINREVAAVRPARSEGPSPRTRTDRSLQFLLAILTRAEEARLVRSRRTEERRQAEFGLD